MLSHPIGFHAHNDQNSNLALSLCLVHKFYKLGGNRTKSMGHVWKWLLQNKVVDVLLFFRNGFLKLFCGSTRAYQM